MRFWQWFLAAARGIEGTERLDTQESARFLSYSGILLESGRWEHELDCATSESGLPKKSGSGGKLCRTGSRRQLGSRRKAGRSRYFGPVTRPYQGCLPPESGLTAWPEPGPGARDGLDRARGHSRRQIF
jgi:hypothetical protein